MSALGREGVFLFEGFRLDRQARALCRRDAAGAFVPTPVGSRAFERAAAELAEARRLAGDDRYSSIARLRAGGCCGSPKTRALYEATFLAGLRKAGVPEDWRWSQATERVLGIDGRRPTLKWNSYGQFVAHLYDGLGKERLFA